jgi:hypothetical protein
LTAARRRLSDFLDVEANERMTLLVGLLLIPLLGVESLTAVSVRRLLPIHLLVGLWLLPVVALKMASTGYRMVMYYARNHAYLSAGPPRWAPRLLAPVVVASTIALFISGTVLWAAGPAARDPWLAIHKAGFVIWGASTGVHVLIHLRHTVHDGFAELASGGEGRSMRRGLAAGAVVLGLVVGVVGFGRGPAWPSGDGDSGPGASGQR